MTPMLPEMPEVDEESEAGCDKAVVSVLLLPFFSDLFIFLLFDLFVI